MLRSFLTYVAVVILVEGHDAVEAFKEQASNNAIELTMSNVCLGKADQARGCVFYRPKVDHVFVNEIEQEFWNKILLGRL